VTTYTIEDGIPAPAMVARKGPPKSEMRRALEALQPGQSFLVDDSDEYRRLRTAVCLLEAQYVTKKIPAQGWRVWRVA
jgi:hypothetical protein